MNQTMYKGTRMCQEHDASFAEEALNILKNTKWDTLVSNKTILTAPCTAFTDAGLELSVNGNKLLIPSDKISVRYNNDPTKRVEGMNCVGNNTAFILCKDDKGEYYGSRIAVHERVQEWLETLPQGAHIQGRVTAFANYGAFVDVAFGYVAMLPISNISIVRITHPGVILTKGDVIDVLISRTENKFTLSLKELLPNWDESLTNLNVGDTVTGIVRYKTEFGTFIGLGINICGLTADNSIDMEVGDKCSVTIKAIMPEVSKIKLIVVNPSCGKADKMPIIYGDNITKDVVTDWVFNPHDTRKRNNKT